MSAIRHRDATTPVRTSVTGPVNNNQSRARLAYTGAWLAPVIAVVATYTVFMIKPWPHSSLSEFLAMFGRNNASAWPMQLVWYAAAIAMIGLAPSPRRATPLICLLAAANLAWIGLGYFAWLNPDMGLSAAWATVFVVEAVLFVVAGLLRRDLVIRPRWDVSSLLGATFMVFSLIVYPVAGLLGGNALHTLPVFGLSPCATVTFYFGLLLWAEPPVRKYLVLLPLAWALVAAPPNLARGTIGDYFMLVAAAVTAIFILWRDRTSARRTLIEGLLLALMIVNSGHDDRMIEIAVVLLAATLVQTIRDSRSRRPAARPVASHTQRQTTAA